MHILIVGWIVADIVRHPRMHCCAGIWPTCSGFNAYATSCLQATEGNDADAAASGPAQADETVLGAATGPAAAGIAAAAGGLAVALGGREQPAAALGGIAAAPAAPAAPAAAAAVAPVAAKAPVIDLLGGDDVYVPNGERTAWTACVLVTCV
jgi:hypothetical protein